MLSLDSMDLSQLKSALSIVQTQISTYNTYKQAASKIYLNVMDGIANIKSQVSSQKLALENTKSNLSTKKEDSVIPSDLLEVKTTNADISTSSVELACMQISKENAAEEVNKYEDRITKLKSWQKKIEDKISKLEKKANEYQETSTIYVSNKVQSTINNVPNDTQSTITKVTSGDTTDITTVINKTNLTKV